MEEAVVDQKVEVEVALMGEEEEYQQAFDQMHPVDVAT
jgi:hypothetical protein